MAFLETVARRLLPQTFAKFDHAQSVAGWALESLRLRTEESFSQIERDAAEDGDWVKINGEYQEAFSRQFLNFLIKQARLYFYKNPIIRRGVLLQSYYAFGRGVEIRIEGDDKANESLQEFVKLNSQILGSTGLADAENTVQTDGNLFVACFTDKALGTVRLRVVDALEISDILTDPGDRDTPRYYLRTWSETSYEGTAKQDQQKKAWHPDLDYSPEAGHPDTLLDGTPVRTDVPILHRKINAPLGALFGIPEVWSALDWAKAVRLFLESWLTKEQSLSRFAWEMHTKGGQKAVDAMVTRLGSTLSTGRPENNPPVNTGAAFIGGIDSKINALKTAGANADPEQMRRALHMAIMNMGPETMFGDAHLGGLGNTGQHLDRPTELKFKFCQERWKEDIKRLGEYAIQNHKKAPGGELRGPKETAKTEVLVSMPDILEHDLSKRITAMVSAFTLDGKTPAGVVDQKTMSAAFLHELGFKDVSALVDEMYPKGTYHAIDWAAATPAERAEAAEDMAARATAIASKSGANQESFGAAMLAQTALKLVEATHAPRT